MSRARRRRRTGDAPLSRGPEVEEWANEPSVLHVRCHGWARRGAAVSHKREIMLHFPGSGGPPGTHSSVPGAPVGGSRQTCSAAGFAVGSGPCGVRHSCPSRAPRRLTARAAQGAAPPSGAAPWRLLPGLASSTRGNANASELAWKSASSGGHLKGAKWAP